MLGKLGGSEGPLLHYSTSKSEEAQFCEQLLGAAVFRLGGMSLSWVFGERSGGYEHVMHDIEFRSTRIICQPSSAAPDARCLFCGKTR